MSNRTAPIQCLIAEFPGRDTLETAIEVLDKSGYTTECVSIVTRASDIDQSPLGGVDEHPGDTLPAEKTTAATTLAGGTLGAILGTATMVGPMLVAGPILGMAAGAIGGSVISAVETYGVKKDIGQQYADRIHDGSALVIVTGDDAKLGEAQRLLKTCGPTSMERFAPD